MKAATTLLALALGIAMGATAAAADQVYYTNTPRDIVPQVPDLSSVAKVRFFASNDGAKTWKLLKELPVPEGAKTPPRLEFRPEADGAYVVATSAVYKKGTAEADPKPGQEPTFALHIVVDTIKPALGAVDATLDKAAPDSAMVAVTWSASDANFGTDPVAIEASSDGGATWPISFPAAAQGATKIKVPLNRTSRTVQVRVTARDLAGNVSTSEARHIELPPPPDPEVELSKAVNSLPTVVEQPKKEAQPSATAAQQPGNGEPPKLDLPAEDHPDTTPADAGRPEIVALAPGEATASPADGGFIAAAPESTARHEGITPEARTEPGPQPAQPVDESIQPDPDAPFLPNPDAEQLLQQAHEQEREGDRAGALATYRRLHRSGQAMAAINDELRLLQEMGANRRIVDTVEALPPEYVGDRARLSQGRALVSLANYAEARRTLSRVHAGAPEAREAMWLIAKCLDSEGRAPDARKVLATLAKGDDEWATRAQQELK
jgi:hypothetical protein